MGLYRVDVVKVGESDIPGPELFWMADWDRWHRLDFLVAVVRGDGVTALVNTGPPDDITPINEVWTSFLGERAALRRREEERIVPALARIGVSPDDVTHLVCTPFQLYSTGNIPLFANARICLSRRGWVHYHTTHDHPHDVRWNSISKDVLVHLVVDAWDRVVLLDDEHEVAPGLRTWWCGVHHRASIVVEADTAVGTVAISDAFFHYENVEANRILGITENMYEALACYERVRNTADLIVPLYEPRVFDRHPGGVVAG